MPYVLGFLVRFVDGKERHRSRIGIKQHIFMRIVERIQRRAPFMRWPAVFHIRFAQGLDIVGGGQAHATEQRVTYQHGKTATVAHHRFLGGRRAGIQVLTGLLPFVHQAGVYRAHHQPQPGNDVFHFVAALVGWQGTVQRAVRLGKVAQQGAFVAHDAQLLDVALEVGGRFQHVAQHGFRTQVVVARPRHRFAVLAERGEQQLAQGARIRYLGNAVQALLVFHAFRLHGGHGRVLRLALLRAKHLARVFQRRLHHGYHVERVGFAFRVQQLQRRQKERR